MAGLGTFSGGGLGFGIRFFLEDAFSAVADKIKGAFDSLDEKVTAVADRVNSAFGKVAAGAGMVATALGLLAPVWRAIQEQGKFEETQIAFETMLGSAEQMKKVVQEVNDLAVKTPYNLEDVEAGYKKLLAYGTPVEDLKRDFTALGNITAGLGGGADTLESFIKNLGQIRAVGRLTGKDFNDFATRGFNLIEALDKIGVHLDLSKKDISQYRVPFATVLKAIHAAGEEGGRFANLMDKLSGSTVGKISNMGDYVDRIFRQIGINIETASKGLFDYVLGLLDTVSKWLATPIGKWVSQVAVGALVAVALMLAVGGLIMILVALGDVLVALAGFFWELFVPLIPLAAAIYVMYLSWEEFTNLLEGKKAAVGNWGKMLAQIGGILQGVYEILTSMNDEGFSLPEEMVTGLENLGILDTVITLGKIIVALRNAFIVLWEAISTVFMWIWENIFMPLFENVLVPFVSWLAEFALGVDKNANVWDKFAAVARVVGYVIGGVLGAIIVLMVLWATVTLAVWTVIVSVIKFMYALLYTVWTIIATIVYAVYLVIDTVIYMIEFIIAGIIWLIGAIFGLSDLKAVGAAWIDSIKEGIKSKWSDFVSWITGMLKGIPWVGKWLFGEDEDTAPPPVSSHYGEMYWQPQMLGNTAGFQAVQNGSEDMTTNKATAAAGQYVFVNQDQNDQPAPVVNTNIYLDGDQIANHVIDKMDVNSTK